jgi:xylose dehydrogenase (NAD/NADP)
MSWKPCTGERKGLRSDALWADNDLRVEDLSSVLNEIPCSGRRCAPDLEKNNRMKSGTGLLADAGNTADIFQTKHCEAGVCGLTAWCIPSMSTSTRKIRWGVLGYARIAREALIPAIQRSSNSVFHAIASRETAKLDECQKKFGRVKTYRSYEELLGDPEVDAVYIPLPNALHREWTIKAAEHGKHVLCEKPIGLNAAECREMIAASTKHGVTLMEAFMYRYTDCTRKVIEVLRSGALGEIKFIYSAFRFLLANPGSIKYKPELGGGSLYDVGCYPLNFTGMVVDEIARIQAAATGKTVTTVTMPESISVQCVKEGGVDVLFSALLKYPSGLVASINSGFNAQKQIETQIVGSKGVLYVPNTFLEEACSLTLTVDGKVEKTIQVENSDRYRLEVEDFADAVMNKRAPFFSLHETLRNMELIDQLHAACK